MRRPGRPRWTGCRPSGVSSCCPDTRPLIELRNEMRGGAGPGGTGKYERAEHGRAEPPAGQIAPTTRGARPPAAADRAPVPVAAERGRGRRQSHRHRAARRWRGSPSRSRPWRRRDAGLPQVRRGPVPRGQDVEMAVFRCRGLREEGAVAARGRRRRGSWSLPCARGCSCLVIDIYPNAGEEMLGAGILDLETRGGQQRFMQHAACEVTIDGATEDGRGLSRITPA